MWAGVRRRERFRTTLRADLEQVLTLVREGHLRAQVAAVFPLSEAAEALRVAESGGVVGKVILTPDP